MLAILSKQWSGVAGLLPAFPRNIKVVCWACVLGFPGGSVVKNLPANAETQVRSLIGQDPTCVRITKPVCHIY